MKRVLYVPLIALAAAVGSLAAAAPTMVVDDSGIDYVAGTYAESGLDTGYVALERRGDDLVLVLSQGDLGSGLPEIDMLVRDAGYDRRGELRQADIADVEGIELVGAGAYYTAFTVTHPDASLGDVVGAWTAALEALGFDGDAEELGLATTVATFEGPDGGLRVVFYSTAEGVRVHVARAA